MGNENHYSPKAGFIRYDVSYENGKFVKKAVYEDLPYVSEPIVYEDSYASNADQPYEQVQTEEAEPTARRKGSKGKTIAKAALALSLAMGATYAGDAVSTFIQKQGKVITPSEAYDDLTE